MTTTSRKPHILIIYTGGTIGMIENPDTHSLEPFDFTHLIDNVPKIKMLDYDIDNIQFNPPIDSSDMSHVHWVEIARHIEENFDRFDGFVVLQTYAPKHYVYRFATNYDYFSFYEKEINLRQATGFPPFSNILRILVSSVCRELF